MTDAPDYTEALICRRPIVVRRRVLWSECDPARIVYTGRIFDYVSAAYGWFQRGVLNEGESLASHGLGTPMKALALEFHSMLWPDDWFEMAVAVTEIRTRTFDIAVLGTKEGKPAFTGKVSPIFNDDATKMSVAIPEQFRAKLEAYRTIAA